MRPVVDTTGLTRRYLPDDDAMPTRYQDDQTPVVQFDLRLEVSAFLVFRRLRDGKIPMILVDVREHPSAYTLEGAIALPEGWEPPEDKQVVLFDDDGSEAVPLAERFSDAGYSNVKALFGGLELWKFSLDPEVVGEETYLVKL